MILCMAASTPLTPRPASAESDKLNPRQLVNRY
jgi:hypothetical protein